MSALLLTNTFAAPQTAQVQGSEASPSLASPGQTQAETIGTATGPEAVAPAQAGREARGSRQSTSYSGSGSGAGGAIAQQPVWAQRSPDATPASVVAARAAPLETDRIEQIARDAAMALIDARRDAALIDRMSQPAEVIDTAQQTREMANQMPDPLPTAPVLQKD